MSTYHIPRHTPKWFEREASGVSPLAKKLATLADAPKGLSEAEQIAWLDVYNSLIVLPGEVSPEAAKAAADAFLEASNFQAEEDIDDHSTEGSKWKKTKSAY